MDWLGDHQWAAWLALAAALGVGEMFSLDLILGMLAVGALVGMVAGALAAPVVLQVLLAVAAAAATLTLLRPSLVHRLHDGPGLTTGHQKLVGSQGIAVTRLTAATSGQIRLEGEIWTAKPYDDTTPIAEGQTVEVFEIRGATAYVHPLTLPGSTPEEIA
ncbi:NfeD family protein [Nocardioides acrostichi]|uniref:NfeD family protein n=1 Tax=Nocardioides acrostichi TaxID=2784339 RepID=A0A930UYD6_9ACTN|nr:NfeD family protein [Nocardioides acrostichi]MBF4163143.1 NfeD family protein [Nocardioides acrostichi]